MKELVKQTVHLDEYDLNVNLYLTIAQIDAIAKSAIKFSKWAEREANIIALTMYFATDIKKEEIESAGVENIVASGLWDEVRYNICNIQKVYDAIEYMESPTRGLLEVLNTINAKVKGVDVDKLDAKKIANQLAKIVKEAKNGANT